MSTASQSGPYHEVSGNPHQYGEKAQKTNVSRHGGKIIAPDGNFMEVNRKGSKQWPSGAVER